MTLRVFLVEDMAGIRALIGDLFAYVGGVVLVASASTEAEAKLWMQNNFGGWDVAIVDLVLDQGSGMEVVRYAKQNFPQTRTVVFSSFASPGIRAHCLALGADEVFDKSDTQAFTTWLHAASRGGP